MTVEEFSNKKMGRFIDMLHESIDQNCDITLNLYEKLSHPDLECDVTEIAALLSYVLSMHTAVMLSPFVKKGLNRENIIAAVNQALDTVSG